MNSEENKSQDINNNVNLENQVEDNKEVKPGENVEVLNDEIEDLEEIVDDNNNVNTNTEATNENKEEVKKIKILNKEFNFEDIVLILIGLIIVASIFLMPRIMDIFN